MRGVIESSTSLRRLLTAEDQLVKSVVEEGTRIKDPFDIHGLLEKRINDLRKLRESSTNEISSRRFILNFPANRVGPGSVLTSTVQTSIGIIPGRILIAPDVTRSITIIDFRVGLESQLAANITGGIPGIFFSSEAADLNLRYDFCRVGENLTLVVRNDSMESLLFRGAIVYRAI